MHAQARPHEGRERARGHGWTEIGPADPDVDDIGKGLSRRAAQGAVANLAGKGIKSVAGGENVWHHVATINHHGASGKVAQCHMQRRAVLGGVDLLAGKQRRALALNIGGAGERQQMGQRGVGDAVL